MFLLILSLMVLATIYLLKQNSEKARSYVPIRTDDAERHLRYRRQKRQ